MRKFLGVVAILAILLGMGACTKWTHRKKEVPPAAVTIGSAPAASTKITVPPPNPDVGIAASDRWPDPCGLVTDGELRAVLPQATSIARAARSRAFTLHDSHYRSTGRMVVPRQSCEITFDLPHTKDYDGRTGLLTIALDMVGTRTVAWMNYSQPTKAAKFSECAARVASEYQCRKGGVVFTIGGRPGFGVTFAGQQDTGHPAADQVYFTKVLPEFRKLILAKLP